MPAAFKYVWSAWRAGFRTERVPPKIALVTDCARPQYLSSQCGNIVYPRDSTPKSASSDTVNRRKKCRQKQTREIRRRVNTILLEGLLGIFVQNLFDLLDQRLRFSDGNLRFTD